MTEQSSKKRLYVYTTHTQTTSVEVELPFFYKNENADCTVWGRIDAQNHLTVTIGSYGDTKYHELEIEPNPKSFPKKTFDASHQCDADTFASGVSRMLECIQGL